MLQNSPEKYCARPALCDKISQYAEGFLPESERKGEMQEVRISIESKQAVGSEQDHTEMKLQGTLQKQGEAG